MSQQKIPSPALNQDDLRVWHHPVLLNAIEVLEIFSIEPGDGRLAACLVLVADQLIKQPNRDRSANPSVQTQAMMATRDRAFDWLIKDVDSAAYTLDPSKSTNQPERALNCALLLFCSQLLRIKLPSQNQEKAHAYIKYMSEQGWPRDDLLPFVTSRLHKPHDLAINAKQHLLSRVVHWRSQMDIQGISYALIQCYDELEQAERNQLAETIRARLSNASTDVSVKAWALLALSKFPGIAKSELNVLAEALLDDLAQDRFINNEITPTVRLINQFPFSPPSEISRKVSYLKQRGYAPAKRIREVNEGGVLIDMFNSVSDETWSFSLHATQVAFAVYALVATGYYAIVGFPAHNRTYLEESIREHVEVQAKRATVIPVNYVKGYNIISVLVILQIGGVVGAAVAELSGGNWQKGGLAGIGLAAVFSIVSVYSQKFVIVGIWDWIKRQLENLLGNLGKK